MNKIYATEFEKTIKYEFKDKSKLKLAFTHSSYANEHKKSKSECNERLEFLGDAVLSLVISEYIYNNFPQMPEGELTKLRASLVCETTLAELSRSLNLGENLLLGKGEEGTGGRTRDSILADAFESVIGAVFLDGGIDEVREYIMRVMKSEIDIMKQNFRTLDCKTSLQEFIQKTSKLSISYSIIDEKGPDHDKLFVSAVSHNGKILGTGEGKSKKEAEQNAAYNALTALQQQ